MNSNKINAREWRPMFPTARLMRQILRRIKKPLSGMIMTYIREQPLLRKYLVHLGRFYCWCQDTILVIPVRRKRCNTDGDMTEVGAHLLFELLILGILAKLIIYEAGKKAERVDMEDQEFMELEKEKNRLMQRIEHQVILTKQLKDTIVEYARQVGCALPSDPETEKDE